MTDKNIIVIGGGHNGLVCATYLARAGRKVTVLESRDSLGGAADTREFAPGFKASTAHLLYLLDSGIAKDLGINVPMAKSGMDTISLDAGGQHVRISGASVDGVSADDLARVVGAQSLDLPAGTIESDEIEVMVRFTDERRSVEEFENLVVVSGETGGEIRLGDVATITDVFEPAHVKTLYNGHRAGILKIEKTKEEDVLTVYDAVTEFVERTAATAPKGVTIALDGRLVVDREHTGRVEIRGVDVGLSELQIAAGSGPARVERHLRVEVDAGQVTAVPVAAPDGGSGQGVLNAAVSVVALVISGVVSRWLF